MMVEQRPQHAIIAFLRSTGRPCTEDEILKTLTQSSHQHLQTLLQNLEIDTTLVKFAEGNEQRLYWLKGQVFSPAPDASSSDAPAAPAPSPSSLDSETQEAIELAVLRSRAEALDQQIARYSSKEQEYDREIKEHMERVHEYNEVKDVAQALMGRLATIEGVLTRDLYKRYGLGLDD